MAVALPLICVGTLFLLFAGERISQTIRTRKEKS